VKRDGRWFWLVAIILIAALGGYFFMKWWNRDIVSIKTATISIGTIEAVVSASGIVNAPVYSLGPKLGGKIMVINVREGQRVSEGQTLAEFDDTSRVVAPASGVVAKINYDVGETVIAGSSAIVVVNYDRSWVEAQIDEIDIAGVKIGDRVKISSDVYPDKIYEGEIYWIAPLAELRKVGGRVKGDEESYVFPCKIKFLGKHEELKVNMSVNVDIVTQRNEESLLVPREALASKDDFSVVFVVRKNRVFQTRIDIGIRSYNYVEAVSGLKSGDVVAITNLSLLKDKGRIQVGP
jgi:multidrug efflux pump subunit AcrA (membrane-fusion protein)